MSAASVEITEGAGTPVATYTITEGAETRHLQRIVLNKSDGTEVDIAAILAAIEAATEGTQTAGEAAATVLGATGDAAATAAATGTISAKLRTVTAQLNTISGYLDGVEALLGGPLTVGLPTGASTAAKQDTGNASVAAIDTTLGAKTDAKSTATDTTSVSGISIWKQISASVQAIAASIAGTLTVATHAVTGSGNFASTVADGANVTLGAKTDAKSTATDATSITIMQVLKQISASIQAAASSLAGTLTVAAHHVTNAGTFAVQATLAAGATNIAKAEDVASADGDVGVPAMVVRKATPANSSGADGDYEFLQASGGYLWVHDNKGLSNLAFSAVFTTLTRPANTTAYAAGDHIANNATAGSVTAFSATIADVNDDPLFLSEILIDSTDTGLAGKKIRANVFNADPTASSGVGGGDNAAYSQKKNGYIGTFVGTLETGGSDGTFGRLTPSFRDTNYTPAGGFVVTKPTSGAKTLYIQLVAEEAFTPSANSTTIIATARGWQARAA